MVPPQPTHANSSVGSTKKVLHRIRSVKEVTSEETLAQLKQLQYEVELVAETAKTRWSRLLVEQIHNMPFRPKEAWANI